jgi:hypothetical protein
MNDLNRFPENPAVQQGTKRPRRDFLTAQRIEVGISIQECHGTYAAAKYMRSKEIDITLVRRILTQPHKRRMYRDWNYME